MALYNFTNCCKSLLNNYKISRLVRRNNFYVLLPEVPPDTPDNNPLLSSTSAPPPFSQLTPKHFYNAAVKRFFEFENNICSLEEDILDGKKAKTFESILEPLDRYNQEIDSIWNTLRNLYLVKQSDAMSSAYFSLISRYHRTKFQQYSSPTLYYAVKELKADSAKLTEPQQRLVDKFLLECRMNGLEVPETKKKIFASLQGKITQNKHKISTNLDASLRNYSRKLENPEQMKEFPESLLYMLAMDKSKPRQGPWQASLYPAALNGILQYSSNRELRRSLYVASITRCWRNDTKLSISLPIEYLRESKTQLANLLGYDSYAHLSMESKMAGSVDNVTEFLTRLREHCQPRTAEELAMLQDYAMSQGADYNLDLYDIPYWQHRHKQVLYGLDDLQVSQYFPFSHVLQGIFNLFHNLFGLTFQECTSEVEVWDPDVTYYKIKDEDGSMLGSFFLDPYHRPRHKMGGTWVGPGSGRCDANGSLPLAYLNCSLTPPLGPANPSLLTFQQVSELLQKMGQVVQLAASKAPYSQLGGLNAVDWEVVELWPQLVPRWLLQDHSRVAQLSSHVVSGKPLPADLHSRLMSAAGYMPHFHLLQEAYLADLDLTLYLKEDHWADIAMAKWEQYQPFPMGEKYNHVCQFSEILSGKMAACYYTRLWSQMLAADLGNWMREQPPASQVARKLCDQLLLNPGSKKDIYQSLRGQSASLQPLLDSLAPLPLH